jgi:glutaredoxin-related protein
MKSLLKAIILEDCPYSMALVELLDNNEIPFTKIMVKRINKEKHKTPEISTFPQLYLDNLLIGGYDTSKKIFDIINNTQSVNDLDTLKKELNDYFKNYNKESLINNKKILRLIKLFIR